jgi:hypothetical protein
MRSRKGFRRNGEQNAQCGEIENHAKSLFHGCCPVFQVSRVLCLGRGLRRRREEWFSRIFLSISPCVFVISSNNAKGWDDDPEGFGKRLYKKGNKFKETLINSVLRANRCVAVVLKPLRTLSTRGLCAPRGSPPLVGWRERSERRGGALHTAKQIPQHFLMARFQREGAEPGLKTSFALTCGIS